MDVRITFTYGALYECADATANVSYNLDCLDLGVYREVIGETLIQFALVDIGW